MSPLKELWHYLRRLSGDDAYDRYLAHQLEAHSDRAPLSRAAFYAAREEQKWSGVNRCC